MSDEIQTISQGNYILHNIDSKKLYVQEPLFTDNSGDAVYVGWRPDETVLWSGSYTPVNGGEITLNESVSAFEKFEITLQGHASFTPQVNTYQYIDSTKRDMPIMCFGHPSNQNGFRINSFRIYFNSSFDGFTISNSFQQSIIGTTVSTGANSCVISKIVGVNRKENA